MTLLSVVAIGHVGGQPQLRYTPDGTSVCNFNMAINRRWTDRDGNPQEKTTWIRVTCWRSLAETVNQFVETGHLVAVTAEELSASAFIPTNDSNNPNGRPLATIELTARSVRFLTPKNKKMAGVEAVDEGAGAAVPAGGGEEDTPF